MSLTILDIRVLECQERAIKVVMMVMVVVVMVMMTKAQISIIFILVFTFMQGIYNYISTTNHVPMVYSVAFFCIYSLCYM
jgi:hypothetical protein